VSASPAGNVKLTRIESSRRRLQPGRLVNQFLRATQMIDRPIGKAPRLSQKISEPKILLNRPLMLRGR
jgi:hypothetical protein